MKARSRKFLGAAVAVAAMAAYAAPAVHAQSIIFEFGTPTGSIDSTAGGSVSFPVLALVTGTDLANTGLVSAQFSLVQTPGTLTNGVLSFSLSSAYDETGTHGANSFVFGQTLAAGSPGGSLGGGVGSGPNDSIIAITGINNSAGDSTVNKTAPAPTGGVTQVVGGSTYNVFNLGTGTLTVAGASTAGSTTNISIAPRGGLGNLIKPQVAIINSALAQFRGDDAAVAEGAPLTITATGTVVYPGDANDSGFVDATDFGILVGHYLTSTTNGHHDGDFDNSGFVDSTDFGILVGHYLTGPNPPSGAVLAGEPSLSALVAAVPEPTSLSMLLAAPLLMARRRRSK